MGQIHAAGEWLRLSEHYRGMTDGELIAIARDRSKLTEIARQPLTLFILRRQKAGSSTPQNHSLCE